MSTIQPLRDSGPLLRRAAGLDRPEPAKDGHSYRRIMHLSEALSNRRQVFVLSNRGPVSFRQDKTGRLVARSDNSAASSLFGPLAAYLPLTWIATSSGEADRLAMEAAPDGLLRPHEAGSRWAHRFIVPPRRAYHRFYNVICNPLLWFIHHESWNPTHTPNIGQETVDAWENGYVPVNQAFADAVAGMATAVDRPSMVFIRDYPLYLAPAFLREKVPATLLHFGLEVPWPGPSAWSLLPPGWRAKLLAGLLACDFITFQGARDVRNFMATVEEYLQEAAVDRTNLKVAYRDRVSRLDVQPHGANVESLRRIASSLRAREIASSVAAPEGVFTFVRVERAEPQKNIVRTIRAFGTLLHVDPALKDRVRLLLVLAPVPSHLAPYRRYEEEIRQAANEVVSAHSDWAFPPVDLRIEHNYLLAIAALASYDTLIATPLADATVSALLEGPVINRRDGTVILSETAGPWERLRHDVLTVAPADVGGLADAMKLAMGMTPEFRKTMASRLRNAVVGYDVTAAAEKLLAPVVELA